MNPSRLRFLLFSWPLSSSSFLHSFFPSVFLTFRSSFLPSVRDTDDLHNERNLPFNLLMPVEMLRARSSSRQLR